MSRRSIPNAITIARLLSLPVFVWLYAQDAPQASWPTAVLVLVMALSDVLDGWLARRYHWQTDLGRVLDPVADRILFIVVVSTLMLFGTLPWWAVVPLVVRDAVLLIGAAVLLFAYHEPPVIMRGGRAANLVLICGVQFFVIDLRTIGWIVYAIGAALYVLTGVRYVWREALGRRRRRELTPHEG
jgi:cardiolipin synthase (CMP-forming)